MSKKTNVLYLIGIIVGLIIILNGVFYLSDFRDANIKEQDLRDDFCISSGYQEYIERWVIKNNTTYIRCLKELINIDDNGVITFEDFNNWVMYIKIE